MFFDLPPPQFLANLPPPSAEVREVEEKSPEVAQTFPFPMEAGRGVKEAPLGFASLFGDNFESLKATPAQVQAITDMIRTLANTPLLFLGGKRSYLRKKGEETNGVHTLKFLAIILTDTNPDPHDNLKQCFLRIRSSRLKWNGFLNGEKKGDGIAGALDKLANENQLAPYLPGFYKAINVDPAKAQPYLEKREWGPWMDVIMGRTK